MPSAVLSSRHDAGGGLLLVALDIEHQVARAYTTPGQYIHLKTDSGNGYFVLAGDIGLAPWEVVVRNVGGAAEALATLPVGSPLVVEGPLGAGFPVARMKARHVVIAIVASAIGVARAVVARRIVEGGAGATHIFLGLREPADVPLPDEVRGWTQSGVELVLCLSRSALDERPDVLPSARRVAGYVQHALARALDAGEVPHGSLVVAAGPEGMLADMRTLGSAPLRPGASGPSIEVLTNV